MNKQALKAIEIETFALSTSVALDELRSVSEDSQAHPSKPETPRRAALRWFIDSFALASCSMAGVYVGVWLDEPNVSDNRPQEERSDRSRRLLDGGVADSPPYRRTGGEP